MIPNKEGWNYIALKQLPAFLIRIILKHHNDFYCFNCLDSFRTKVKKRLKSHKKVCKNK